MMTLQQAQKRLKSLAGDLALIRTSTEEHRAIKSFVLGAIWSLSHAAKLGFKDERGTGFSAAYDRRMSRCAYLIAAGRLPRSGQWLAGASFNSALLRLAAVYHRGLKEMVGKNHAASCLADLVVAYGLANQGDINALAMVNKDVNDLKHTAAGLLAKTRRTRPANAIEAIDKAIGLLKILTST